MGRRRINQVYDPVLRVEISATEKDRLVYLLVANRPVRYGNRYSRILYVGTTGNGVSRIASSASNRIIQAADTLRAVDRLDAYVIWVRSRRGPQTQSGKKLWHWLERAVLLRFCEAYGEKPKLNGTGHKMRETREFQLFARATIDRIIARYT